MLVSCGPMFVPARSSLTDLLPGILLKNQVIDVLRTVVLATFQIGVHNSSLPLYRLCLVLIQVSICTKRCNYEQKE